MFLGADTARRSVMHPDPNSTNHHECIEDGHVSEGRLVGDKIKNLARNFATNKHADGSEEIP